MNTGCACRWRVSDASSPARTRESCGPTWRRARVRDRGRAIAPPQCQRASVRAAWAPVRVYWVQRATGQHIPVFIGAITTPRIRTCRGSATLLSELDPQSAFRVSRLDEFFKRGGRREAAPLAGELRWSYRYAWTLQGLHGRGHRSARIPAELAVIAPRRAAPRRWRGARVDATGGRCSSSRGAHCVRCQSMMPSRLRGRRRRARGSTPGSRASRPWRGSGAGSVHDLVHHDPDAAAAARCPASAHARGLDPAARPVGGHDRRRHAFRREVLVGPRGIGSRGRAGYGRSRSRLGWPHVPVQVLDLRIGMERLDAAHHYPEPGRGRRGADRVPGTHGAWTGAGRRRPGGVRGDGPVLSSSRRRARQRTLLINHWIEVALEPTGAPRCTTGAADSALRTCCASGTAAMPGIRIPTARRGPARARDGPVRVRRLRGASRAALEPGSRSGDAWGYGRRHRVRRQPHVRCILDIDNQAAWHAVRDACPFGLAGAAALAGTAVRHRGAAPVTVDPADYPSRRRPHGSGGRVRGGRPPERAGSRCSRPAFFEYEWTGRETCWSPCCAPGASCRAATSPPGRATRAGPIHTAAQCPGESGRAGHRAGVASRAGARR